MVTPNNILGEFPDEPEKILTYRLPEGTVTSWAEYPNFSCFLIHRSYFDLVGTFDENFIPAWYEDNDAHRRINLLGFKAITTTKAPMVHFGGVSTSLVDNPDSSVSREYYIKKWGGIPHPAKEIFTTPYNDPSLTPKEWIQQ
jgi:GT2 family glycosyltransferase